jgi:hypothetical protein
MLDAFYTAFSPACLSLLGLWIVAVQMRADEVRADPELSRRTYVVALFFALPGLMSVFALIDSANPVFWRVAFAVMGLGGAASLIPARGLPGTLRIRDVADVAAVILYLAIAILAMIGGLDAERAAAALLTVVIFLGFNIAWLFLFAPLDPADRPKQQEPRTLEQPVPTLGTPTRSDLPAMPVPRPPQGSKPAHTAAHPGAQQYPPPA